MRLLVSLLIAASPLSAWAEGAVPTQNLLAVYQQAMAHDPALASATSGNKAAQELITQGKALYRPTVNLVASANSTRQDYDFVGLARPSPTNPLIILQNKQSGVERFEQRRYGVEARQPIFRKQNLVQMTQSEIQVSQSDKQLLLTQQELMMRTTQAYFDVLNAQDRITLITAQKEAIQSQLKQAQANFEVGTATITDVNEAQARFDLIVAQEIAAINEHDIAKRAIEAITGEIPQALNTVRSDFSAGSINDSIATWQQTARENNLNIRIQEDTLKFAEQDVARAKAGHLPTLDAVASYTDSYANGGINTQSTGSKNTVVGIEFSMPLYAGGAISSRARQAELNRQKAVDDLELERRKASLETQRAYLNLNTSIAQVKALEQALTSSQSQLDSTKLGYEVGVRTSVDVLNAQQQLFSAKRDLLQARYGYLVNVVRLKFASGVLTEADLQEINQHLVTN